MGITFVDKEGNPVDVDTSPEACAFFHDGDNIATPGKTITGPDGPGKVVGGGEISKQKVLYIALDELQGDDPDVVVVSWDFQCFTDCTDLQERDFSLED